MTEGRGRSDSTRFSDEAPDSSPAESLETNASDVGDVDSCDTAPSGEFLTAFEDLNQDSGVLLADVAPGAESDLARIQSREAEQDAAGQEQVARERAVRQAKHRERYQPQITVQRGERAVTAKDDTGVAVCPACQAKCEFTAALCARCGAEIPAAIPSGQRRGGRRYGNYETFGERQSEDDAWDMLPEEKRREFEEAEVRREQQRRHSVFKVRLYRQRVMAMLAAISAGLGLVTTGVSLGLGFPGALAFLADAGLGAGAGYLLWSRKGGRIHGFLLFGGAGLASIGCKLALGGIARMLGGSIAGAFSLPIYLGVLAAMMILGFLIGTAVESEFLDQHS